MGGCTSKPKVFEDDEFEAPEPAPEKVIEEEKGTVATELAPQQEPEKVVVVVVVEEEDKEVVPEAPEPVSQKVVEEEKAINTMVRGVEKENGEVKDSDDEKAKSEEEQIAEKVENDEVNPATRIEYAETLENKPAEKTESSEEKQQEDAKLEPEKIPIISFFTSLMGQKH